MSPRFIQFHSDNFTDAKRTPWGGTTIGREIKSHLGLKFPSIIGESWEFSTSNDLPSVCKIPSNQTFSEFLDAGDNASRWLSENHRKLWGQKSPALVKYVDARRNLSVQIHPEIDDYSQGASVCGKWEAWLVLKAEPGAGIYFGAKPGATRELLREAAYAGGNFQDLLQFCRVRPGDLISIPPRIVHALGAGVCVLEPQMVSPGRSPVSLRLYDWQHRCDDAGNLSESGSLRPLRIDDALSLIDTDPAANAPGIDNIFRGKSAAERENGAAALQYFSPIPGLAMIDVCGCGAIDIGTIGELAALVVIKGNLDIRIDGEHYSLAQGESGALAADAKNIRFLCNKVWAQAIYCTPGKRSDVSEKTAPGVGQEAVP